MEKEKKGGGHKWSGVDAPLSSSRACPTAFIASPVPVYMRGRCHVRSIVLVPCLPGWGQWGPAGCGFRALSPASWSGLGPWRYMCVPCWLPSPERCARCRWPHSATQLSCYFHRVMEGLGRSQVNQVDCCHQSRLCICDANLPDCTKWKEKKGGGGVRLSIICT